MKKILYALAICMFASCNNKPTQTVEDNNPLTDAQETKEITEEPADKSAVEEDSIHVREFTVLSEKLVNNNSRTAYTIHIPDKYSDMDLYKILDRLKQKCKNTKDFQASFYTSVDAAKNNGSPYGIASVINGRFESSVLANESSSVNSNKDFVGKWDMPGGWVFAIYKENGKFYTASFTNGKMDKGNYELVKTKSHGNTAYKYKNYDDGGEIYEIRKGGVYVIQEGESSGVFYPDL